MEKAFHAAHVSNDHLARVHLPYLEAAQGQDVHLQGAPVGRHVRTFEFHSLSIPDPITDEGAQGEGTVRV